MLTYWTLHKDRHFSRWYIIYHICTVSVKVTLDVSGVPKLEQLTGRRHWNNLVTRAKTGRVTSKHVYDLCLTQYMHCRENPPTLRVVYDPRPNWKRKIHSRLFGFLIKTLHGSFLCMGTPLRLRWQTTWLGQRDCTDSKQGWAGKRVSWRDSMITG